MFREINADCSSLNYENGIEVESDDLNNTTIKWFPFLANIDIG